jgi:hypothetical protein
MTMIKIQTKTLILTLVFLFLVVSPVFGEGLVKCGNEGQAPCTFDDIFTLIGSVIDFILVQLVPAIAVVGVVWAAIIMMTSAGDPGKFETGKRTITYIVVGLAVIYLAWFLVSSFITFIGGADWTTQFFKK